jgi:hypothetical protein
MGPTVDGRLTDGYDDVSNEQRGLGWGCWKGSYVDTALRVQMP